MSVWKCDEHGLSEMRPCCDLSWCVSPDQSLQEFASELYTRHMRLQERHSARVHKSNIWRKQLGQMQNSASERWKLLVASRHVIRNLQSQLAELRAADRS